MEKPIGFDVINLGNNTATSLKDLLTVIEQVLEKKAVVVKRPSHHASVEKTCASTTHAKEKLGWQPTTSLDEGVKKLVSWFRKERLRQGE